MRIAIIGAGISGSNLYKLLNSNDNEITIFEKSRGVGGRCATRYIQDKLIDHGTPHFQSFNSQFTSFCETHVQDGILEKVDNFYFPTYGMNKLCSSMIDKKDLVTNTKITSCKYNNGKWNLKDEKNNIFNNYDKLFITIPAPQVLQLDINLPQIFRDALNKVTYNSIATLLVYAHTLQNIMNPKLVNNNSSLHIIDNSAKYRYENFSSYVLHLKNYYTKEYTLENKNDVQNIISKKVFELSGIQLEEDFHISPHLWKYATVQTGIEEDYFYLNSSSLGLCGDYFNGNNLQSAYLSSERLFKATLK